MLKRLLVHGWSPGKEVFLPHLAILTFDTLATNLDAGIESRYHEDPR